MKTVLTFGVFDILHIGHVLLFMRARELGDRLIVAVQHDDSILKYKPETQIVNSIEKRLFMVESLRYVDEVVTYNDVDEDIQTIDFNLLVVGGDQNHSGFQRAMEWCRTNGKEVVQLSRTEGISSSQMRRFMKMNTNGKKYT